MTTSSGVGEQEFHSWSAVEKAYLGNNVGKEARAEADPVSTASDLASQSVELIHQIIAGVERPKSRTRRDAPDTEKTSS